MTVAEVAETIGFIGLGDMGQPMALNLAKAGFRTIVCDKREEAVGPPAAAGAEVDADASSLASRCSIVCVCVLDDQQVIDLITGPNGILAGFARRVDGGLRPLITVHSTVMPSTMQRLHDVAAEAGVGVVDAPVSGGRAGSVAGRLTLMVSGADDDQARCMPVFKTVGENIINVGASPGMGSVAKLCNNVMALCNTLAIVEAMNLAGAYGIPEQSLIDIANVSTGMSWFTQHWGFTDDLMENHTLAATGEVKYLLTKDLWDAVVAGRDRRENLLLSALGAQAGPGMLERRFERRRAVREADDS